MRSIFDFRDYRAYLKAVLPVSGTMRGSRARLADALGSQGAFVSLVLSGKAHFSLEHGPKVCKFLSHDPAEREYFLLLLHLARAGSKELESFYLEKIEAIHSQRRQIKERVSSNCNLTEVDQAVYYSAWYYTAIHMCLLVPHLQSRAAISKALQLPMGKVSAVLAFLLRTGLAKEERGRFVCGPTHIHVPAESPLVSKHHINWRLRAMQSLDSSNNEDLHFSSVMCLSPRAQETIRNLLLKVIEDAEPVINEAKNEQVATLTIDLFRTT